VERVLIDKCPFDAVECQPELIEGLLHRISNHRLLRVGYRVSLDGDWADFHMLFVHAHMEVPAADVFRVGVEAVMLSKTIHDPCHPLAGSAFQAKTLARKKFQPTSLIHQQLAPVEESLRLRRRLNAIQLFFGKPTRLRKFYE